MNNAASSCSKSWWVGLASAGLVACTALGCSSNSDGGAAAGAGGLAGGAAGSSGAPASGGGSGPAMTGGTSGAAPGGTSGGSTAGSSAAGSSAAGSSTAGGSSTGDPDPDSSPCDVVVYDGEPGSHPSGTDSLVYIGFPMPANILQEVHTDPKYGTTALQNILDPSGTCCGTMFYSWTNYDHGPGQPIDGSKSKNFEFWIKVESGTYWNLQIELADSKGVSSFTGADVHIADYTDAKTIDTTWRQAKVPMSAFDTNGIDLSSLSGFIIEGDRAVTFDLDEMKLTRDSCP